MTKQFIVTFTWDERKTDWVSRNCDRELTTLCDELGQISTRGEKPQVKVTEPKEPIHD